MWWEIRPLFGISFDWMALGRKPPNIYGIFAILVLLPLQFCILSPLMPTVYANHTNSSRIYTLWSYTSPISDFGYSFSVDRARLALDDQMAEEGVEVFSIYQENLQPSNCFEAVSKALDQGINGHDIDLWVVGGAQFRECAREVEDSARWPNLKILALQLMRPSARISSLSTSIETIRFLHGMLCAMATKTKRVGYITSMPRKYNVVFRSTLAFYLGVKYIDPSIVVMLGLTGSFDHMVAETKATNLMIEQGKADCIGMHENGLTVHHVATDHHVWTMGYSTDARYFVGESVLSSALYDWKVSIYPFYKQVLNNSWIPNYVLRPQPGVGNVLSAFSTEVLPEWIPPLEEMMQRFQTDSYNMYCMPNFNDPQYMRPGTMIEIAPGLNCLSPGLEYTLHGIPQGMVPLVEYNDTHSPFVILWVRWDYGGAIVVCLASLLLIGAVVMSGIHIYDNLTHPLIVASSPLFLYLILFSILISSISPFFRIGRRTKFNCMASWWFAGLGQALLIACLFAKNWRIWRVFSPTTKSNFGMRPGRRYKPIVILNWELLVQWVAAFVAAEVVLLSIWTGHSPLVPATLSSPSTLKIDELQNVCAASKGHQFTGWIAFLVFNTLLLVPLAMISYWTRGAKQEYKESDEIGVTVYGTLLVTLLVAGVAFSQPWNYIIEFYLASFASLLSTWIAWCALFVPKHIRVMSTPNNSRSSDSEMRLSTRGHTSELCSISQLRGASASQLHRSFDVPNPSREG